MVPAPGELLISVRANALCGSDRHQYEQGADVVPGHETAGVVVAAGSGTSTRIGTRGVVYLMDYCGDCRSCVVGATNQCLAKRADMGFTRDGGYGPYELIHETNFFPVPDTVPLEEATLLLDVMGTAGHAIGRARLVTPDLQSIAVAGAGPVGLGVVVMTHLLLGTDVPVVVGDVQPARLKLVERLGGFAVDLTRSSIVEGLKAIGLSGVDVAIDTAGQGASRRALLDLVAKRGTFVCVGHGQGFDIDVSHDLIAPERAVLGSEYFRFEELTTNVALYLANRSLIDLILTDRFPIAELASAVELFMAGTTGKVVVVQ